MKIKFATLLFLLLLNCGCGTSDRGCRSGDNFDGNATEIESKFLENDKYYLTVKDDINNLYLEYLHRTTARLTLALFSLIIDNRLVTFGEKVK